MKKYKKLLIIYPLILVAVITAILVGINTINKQKTTLLTQSFQNSINTKVGQSMKVIGTTNRTLPEISNGGLSRYPFYGTALPNASVEEKEAIIAENNELNASSSTYNSMDKNGNLLLNGVETGEKLYKHTASTFMYYGDVADDEPAVIKEIAIDANSNRNYITGLYAPAGEVIKIKISNEDLVKSNGLKISIGQMGMITNNSNINNIWSAKNMNRMPVIANIMNVDSTTAYVGSFFGGPIYISPNNSCDFTVTISGAVEYMHYIYGLTTEEEFEEMKNFSAPYFDFEVWDNSVRHSGPKYYAPTDYDNLTKVAELWEKISLTSKQVPTGSNSSVGIAFLYDPFIAAGGAVAFVGRNWCDLPPDWMTGSLDYQNFTSNGQWGTIHEYNHHFQRFGFSPGDEVTNNAVSLLSYILYTNISASRSLSDSTLTDWNRFTDPSRSLRETISNALSESSQQSLNTYADIIHTFGVDTFIYATQFNSNKGGTDNWYQALCEATGYDMTYYFEELLHQTVSEEMKAIYTNLGLPVFVPVATVFQTGRSYFDGDTEVFTETVKPYEIENGASLTLDFNERLILPEGFSFTIKSISNPASGTLKKLEENVYRYTPGSEEYSGTIKMVISLSHQTIVTPDITITINIRQNEPKMNATKYTFATQIYSSTDEALENNFAGYSSINEYQTTSHFMNAINQIFNEVGVIEGKIYIPESGTYIICLRAGRGIHGLYISINSTNNYQKVVSLTGNHPYFAFSGEQTVSLNLKKGDYVYFKEITISQGYDAYMELGWGILENGTATITSIPSEYMFNTNVDYKEYNFTSPTYYPRTYEFNSITYELNQSIVSTENDYGQWDGSYMIDNLVDGNLSTSYHSKQYKYINKNAPFIVTVDLGAIYLCNQMTIYGYNGNTAHLPIDFELYGGETLDDMKPLGSFIDPTYTNRITTVSFDSTNIRYFKLVIFDTDSHTYIAMREIVMGYGFDDGEEKSPTKLEYLSTGNLKFEQINTISTFGHLIVGNGVIKYNFNGDGFGLFVKQNEACTISVSVDGKSQIIKLESSTSKELALLLDNLENGNHEISIVVLSGKIYVDSFIVR